MDHEHTKAVGAVAYIEHDGAGTFPMPQIPGLPRIEGPSAMTHAPHIGEHSAVILKEWGYTDDAIAEMLSKKVTAFPKNKPPTPSSRNAPVRDDNTKKCHSGRDSDPEF